MKPIPVGTRISMEGGREGVLKSYERQAGHITTAHIDYDDGGFLLADIGSESYNKLTVMPPLPHESTKYIDVVMSGPPDHRAPEFVEVEDDSGMSIKVGEWIDRKDGYWALRIPTDNGDVLAFQQKFDIPMSPFPALLDPAARSFRIKFMQEELNEYIEACGSGDLIGAADALVDLVYVVHGTALMMGLPWKELWAEVQRANMTKERAKADGSNSKRGSSLDIIKPAGWQGPDHKKIIKEDEVAGAFDNWHFNTATRRVE